MASPYVGPVVVDSNVFIGLLRQGRDPVEALGSWADQSDLATCGIIRLEVVRGIKVERVRRLMDGFFDVLINVPTSDKLWEQAGKLAWSLDRKGRVLPAQDILIAVSAMSLGAAVLTDDAQFLEIPGLRVLTPQDALPEW